MGGLKQQKTAVENVNVPGHTTRVDSAKYTDMKNAMFKLLPAKAPGLNQSQIREGVKPFLDKALFPGGAKAGWWAKTVQLDLEAKGLIKREKTKPLRWHLSNCLLYTSPSPRDATLSRMPSSA